MATMQNEMLLKFNSLNPSNQKIVLDQIEFLNSEEKTAPRKRSWFAKSLFSWMANPKKDFEMSDDQIDDFISAVRAERRATRN